MHSERIIMADVHRWDQFMADYRENFVQKEQSESSWRDFITKFKDLYADEKKLPNVEVIPHEKYQNFFNSFSSDLKEYYKSGSAVNLWEVAGVGHNEMRNSAILSWLLDCRESHGQGALFMQYFIDFLHENNTELSEKARNNFPKSEDANDINYWTRVESLPFGENESRVDIEVGGSFVLIVEVKVNSAENGDQLSRYMKVAESKAGNRKWGVVYLTKNGSDPADESLRNAVFCLSWGQVASIIEKVASEKIDESSSLRPQLKQLCRHFKSL